MPLSRSCSTSELTSLIVNRHRSVVGGPTGLVASASARSSGWSAAGSSAAFAEVTAAERPAGEAPRTFRTAAPLRLGPSEREGIGETQAQLHT